MTEYSKYNIVYRLQKWMDSVPGQTFLNYAYSWGASIVILGTLFKLTHLPAANLFLFLGMGTEVFVFFISAFDRPFDKTADGMNLPTHVEENAEETVGETSDSDVNVKSHVEGGVGGGTIIIGGGAAGNYQPVMPSNASAVVAEENTQTVQSPVGDAVPAGAATPAAFAPQPNYVPHMTKEEAEALNEAQGSYVEELKELVETLKKVNEQSERLTRDSEEMENLNRTLTGISKVYEIQLKGASAQIGTIDQINDQTRHMADQIAELNRVYARMIEAMTVNMKVASPIKPQE